MRDLRVLMRVVILVQNMQYQVTSHFTQIVQLINKTQSDKHSVSSKYLVIQLFWNSQKGQETLFVFFFSLFQMFNNNINGFSFFLACFRFIFLDMLASSLGDLDVLDCSIKSLYVFLL